MKFKADDSIKNADGQTAFDIARINANHDALFMFTDKFKSFAVDKTNVTPKCELIQCIIYSVRICMDIYRYILVR